MSVLRRISGGLRALLHKQQHDQELEEELQTFIDAAAEQKMRAGMSPAEALRAARIETGGPESVKERVRSVGWESVVESVWQDIRYGVRSLRHSPAFTAVAVLSLAIGIGANTALFSLIDEVLLKSLPVSRPQELVLFAALDGIRSMRVSTNGTAHRDPATGRMATTSFSFPAFQRMQAANQSLSGIFAFAPVDQFTVNAGDQAEIASGQFVTGGYYRTLQVQPVLGRTLDEQDDSPGAPPAAVITWRYWQGRFAGDPEIVGKHIKVNNVPFVIAGVTPPKFNGTLQVGESPDVTLPMAQEPHILAGPRNDLDTGWYWFARIIARLKPGVTMEQAAAQLEPAFQKAVLEGYHQALAVPRFRPRLEPREITDAPRLLASSGAQGLEDLRRAYAQPVRILLAMVLVVLVIGCANVANLLLARGTNRAREIAVRLAVGASRMRLVRQLLTESLLLSALGGVIGMGIAYMSKDALLALRPWGNSTQLSLPIDVRVLLFTIAVSLVTGILFGLAPALRGTRIDVSPALKQSGSAAIGGRPLVSKGLVILQVALSLLLLVASGLFVRTLENLNHVNLGFDPDSLLAFRVDPLGSGYKSDQITSLFDRLMSRLAAVPGVRSVALSRHPLLSGSSRSNTIFTNGKRPKNTNVFVNLVSPSFFRTMRISLLAGRELDDHDSNNAPKVAVVNESMARLFFPDGGALGQRFWFGNAPEGDSFEIVGTVRDAKYSDVRAEIPPTVYYSYRQEVITQANLELQTALDPSSLVASVRKAVQEVDPNLPMFDVKTERDYAEESVAQERMFARFSSAFGAVALMLAAIGLFGVMSYTVARRISEIGIRMALGAQPRTVLWMVLRESLVLVWLGALAGSLASWAAMRIAEKQLASMLYGLRPSDPLTAVMALSILLLAALAASYWPARRAASVDPIIALRQE